MTREIRWRILTLQAVGVIVLALCAGIGYWGASFVHSNVHNQLASQKISFPAANDASIKALPAVDAAAMKQYAGQQMTTGDQANVYANNFIGVHLGEMGMTYSQASGKYLAMPNKTSPAAVKLGELRQTIFMGTMLRSSLLQAWGWYQIGTYALYAAIVLTLGAVVVFFAFLFELVYAPKREGIVELPAQKRGVAIGSQATQVS